MKAQDHTTFREWLDLELDGELPSALQGKLRDHLIGCSDCRTERDALLQVRLAMGEIKVPVQRSFRRRVLEALPAAAWESRPVKSWAAVIALVLVLGAASAGLVGWSAARLTPSMPFAGALSAVWDSFAMAVLAGTGLLGASWKGIGMVMGEALRASWLQTAAFVIILVGLNASVAVLIRRRRRPATAARSGNSARSSSRPAND